MCGNECDRTYKQNNAGEVLDVCIDCRSGETPIPSREQDTIQEKRKHAESAKIDWKKVRPR